MEHTDEPDNARRPFQGGPRRELKVWLISLALASPALLPYVSHFAAPPAGRLPTGFIAYDMPYYLANAREHFDEGRFRLFYSNPFDPRASAPAIYVQPMSLALRSHSPSDRCPSRRTLRWVRGPGGLGVCAGRPCLVRGNRRPWRLGPAAWARGLLLGRGIAHSRRSRILPRDSGRY